MIFFPNFSYFYLRALYLFYDNDNKIWMYGIYFIMIVFIIKLRLWLNLFNNEIRAYILYSATTNFNGLIKKQILIVFEPITTYIQRVHFI